MVDVIVYTTGYCPYCVRAKELLKRKGVPFREINLDGKYEELNELKNRTHHRTVPQIFIGDRFIGGFDELAELEDNGSLDQMLQAGAGEPGRH